MIDDDEIDSPEYYVLYDDLKERVCEKNEEPEEDKVCCSEDDIKVGSFAVASQCHSEGKLTPYSFVLLNYNTKNVLFSEQCVHQSTCGKYQDDLERLGLLVVMSIEILIYYIVPFGLLNEKC